MQTMLTLNEGIKFQQSSGIKSILTMNVNSVDTYYNISFN